MIFSPSVSTDTNSSSEHISRISQETAYDRTLVDRVKAGDDRAFAEICERYRSQIFGHVSRLLRNTQDAEEVTSDTFIRAMRGLANFRGDSALKTWIYQIATNLARNRYWYWKRRRRDAHLSVDAPLSEDGDGTFADVIPNPDDDVVRGIEQREFQDQIARSMEYLSAKHREILLLLTLKHMSYDQIATALGISVGTVKSRIARAREDLRAKLTLQTADRPVIPVNLAVIKPPQVIDIKLKKKERTVPVKTRVLPKNDFARCIKLLAECKVILARIDQRYGPLIAAYSKK